MIKTLAFVAVVLCLCWMLPAKASEGSYYICKTKRGTVYYNLNALCDDLQNDKFMGITDTPPQLDYASKRESCRRLAATIDQVKRALSDRGIPLLNDPAVRAYYADYSKQGCLDFPR